MVGGVPVGFRLLRSSSLQAGVRSPPAAWRAFTPGAPTAALTCEEEDSLLQQADHTRRNAAAAPKQNAFKSSFGDLLSRKVAGFTLHKSTRQQRTRTRRVLTPEEVEADRTSAPHFCSTFERKGFAFLCLKRL